MSDATETLERTRRVAVALAHALDHDDFLEAARWLATDCIYEIGGETRIGSAAIIASYADSTTWGREHFDEMRYESEIAEPQGDTITITYIDHLKLGGHEHTYRCRQHLTIGDEGKVTRIAHEDLPGEREALEAYFRDCSLRR